MLLFVYVKGEMQQYNEEVDKQAHDFRIRYCWYLRAFSTVVVYAMMGQCLGKWIKLLQTNMTYSNDVSLSCVM